MHVLILGTRGVPATHGGFETFAHNLSLFLTGRQHKVTVYCQVPNDVNFHEDDWKGVRRVLIPTWNGTLGTMAFDWISARHASRERGVILTLGYNTGILNAIFRMRKVPNLINMDGIEWKRQKWSLFPRIWLVFNEWAGSRVANHLIADHPEISTHLQRHTSPKKITVIPYGAEEVLFADAEVLKRFNLTPGSYFLLIARPEPENSVLEIVQAYSRKPRRVPLVVLGAYDRSMNGYHKAVIEAASSDVKFLGAIYDRDAVMSLRFHATAYLHGHQVGGTNPSLIESLAAGSAVIARDNRFNRWVAGPEARYFQGSDDLARILDDLEVAPEQFLVMREGSRIRYRQSFTQEQVLSAYERLLLRFSI